MTRPAMLLTAAVAAERTLGPWYGVGDRRLILEGVGELERAVQREGATWGGADLPAARRPGVAGGLSRVGHGLALLVLAVCLASPVRAEPSVIAFVDVRDDFNQVVFDTFREKTGREIRIYELPWHRLDLVRHRARVVGDLGKLRPAAVVAIGADAERVVRGSPVPVVAMGDCHSCNARRRADICLPRFLPPTAALERLVDLAGDVRSLGLMMGGDAEHEGVADIRRWADRSSVKLLEARVETRENLGSAIKAMRGRVDALWVSRAVLESDETTLRALLRFSLRARVPLVVLCERCVRRGALMTVMLRPEDLGRQVAQALEQVLTGVEVPLERAEPLVLINRRTAALLGLSTPKTLSGRPTVLLERTR